MNDIKKAIKRIFSNCIRFMSSEYDGRFSFTEYEDRIYNYNTKQPMEETKKLIEEEAREYVSNIDFSNTTGIYIVNEMKGAAYQGYTDGYNNCLSKWQASERWRNLEDEPPLIEEDSYYVLLKDEDEDTNNVLEAFEIENETDIFHAKQFYTHWKPIH